MPHATAPGATTTHRHEQLGGTEVHVVVGNEGGDMHADEHQ